MRRGKEVVLLVAALVGAVMVLTACRSSSEMPTLDDKTAIPPSFIEMCRRQPDSAICKR